jgi:hypothetical protein
MVLCYSRRMYLEFTVSQEMEFFLACHGNAFAAFGSVPARLMVDNLKSAVLKRLVGAAPVFNPKYLDFSRHWSFEITACNVASGWEKGRVENGVGYVKKNFLAGCEFIDFSAVQPAAQLWVDTVADVRVHGATQRRPVDMFEEERACWRRPKTEPPVRVVPTPRRTVAASRPCRLPSCPRRSCVDTILAAQTCSIKMGSPDGYLSGTVRLARLSLTKSMQ